MVALVAAIAAASCIASCSASSREVTPAVTVFGTLSDAEIDDVTAGFATLERATGIDVRYVGSSNFETDLFERLRRGDPPDLALLPQPSLLAVIVEEGFALAWDGELQVAAENGVDPELLELVTFDGVTYGSWYQLVAKSLVWYRPAEFARRGLTVPTSWEELERLTAEITASGTPPWCLGIRADGATGWVATDWVEDLVLRFEGPEVYDAWVAGDVRFSDPPIRDAVERFGAIALEPDQVAGGNRASVERTVQQAAEALLDTPASCLLHRQGSVLPRLIGGPVDIAPDGDLWAFALPAEGGGPAPMLVGGSVVVRFADEPAVDEVAGFLSSDAAAGARAQLGGFISPREGLVLDRYRRPLDRWAAEQLREADVVRFDASDLMPPDVGVGTFWSGMTSWLGGARLRSVLAEIDASWPREEG